MHTEALDGELPRKVRRKMSAAAMEQRELLLTMPEVKEVVQRALEIQEQRLRIEYDAILVQQLKEQFESFSRFSSEHLSRQVNSRYVPTKPQQHNKQTSREESWPGLLTC
jgi:hypothetical protein